MRVVILWIVLTIIMCALVLCACGRESCYVGRVAKIGPSPGNGKYEVWFEDGAWAIVDNPIVGASIRICK